ncbi:MAG: FMN-binding protein [Planctomycetaceae bacterium]|nr:FMN-binding protein [Planctomycetaceae bacterium]
MNYLKQSWLVIVLALGFGVALAFVQTSLSPAIEKNKLDLTLEQIPSLVPGAEAAKSEQVTLANGQTAFVANDKDGRQVGWVVKGSGLGFADVIEVLVGLTADGKTITGLYVLDQKETPGLGNRITGEEFLYQFRDKSLSKPLVISKASGPSNITPLSGATISSEGVADIVNKTVQSFFKAMSQKEPVRHGR